MKWLCDAPMVLLLPVAVLLALAPFLPEPHLLEKLKLLAAGELIRPVDIFDLIIHGAPLVLVMCKLLVCTSRSGD